MKTKLRQYYLSRRKSMDFAEKEQLDNAVFENLISCKQYKDAKRILLYSSTKFEVDTAKIALQALQENKKIAYPICNLKDCTIDFYEVSSLDELILSYYNILTPIENPQNKVFISELDIVIVPGIIYNNNGYRIGYGKGYYDRFLSSHKITSIGIIYDDFITDISFNDENDKSVDIIISNERKIYIDKL